MHRRVSCVVWYIRCSISECAAWLFRLLNCVQSSHCPGIQTQQCQRRSASFRLFTLCRNLRTFSFSLWHVEYFVGVDTAYQTVTESEI